MPLATSRHYLPFLTSLPYFTLLSPVWHGACRTYNPTYTRPDEIMAAHSREGLPALPPTPTRAVAAPARGGRGRLSSSAASLPPDLAARATAPGSTIDMKGSDGKVYVIPMETTTF